MQEIFPSPFSAYQGHVNKYNFLVNVSKLRPRNNLISLTSPFKIFDLYIIDRSIVTVLSNLESFMGCVFFDACVKLNNVNYLKLALLYVQELYFFANADPKKTVLRSPSQVVALPNYLFELTRPTEHFAIWSPSIDISQLYKIRLLIYFEDLLLWIIRSVQLRWQMTNHFRKWHQEYQYLHAVDVWLYFLLNAIFYFVLCDAYSMPDIWSLLPIWPFKSINSCWCSIVSSFFCPCLFQQVVFSTTTTPW